MDASKNRIAKVMVISVLLSAGVMAVGTAYFLFYHWRDIPGDHLFHGEPLRLRKPMDILFFALQGQVQCVIQLGVLFLLLNPFIRVVFSLLSYALEKDMLYVAICVILLCVLGMSFLNTILPT